MSWARRIVAAMVLVGASFSGVAHGDGDDAGASAGTGNAVTGRWAFRTDIAEKGCTITGTMTVRAGEDGDSMGTCEFVSAETCGYDDPVPTRMEQSCRVVRQGEFLLIRSEVTGSLTDGVSAEMYLPDHFTLTEISAEAMSGLWYDRLYRDTVTFWRPDATPVS